MMGRRCQPWLWLGLIVLFGLAFRLYGLNEVRWNIDEGFWTYGASMAARHGIWWPDGWRQGFLSPFYTWLLYPFFAVFGGSIPVARYVSVALGTASVVSIYFLCIRCGYSIRVALLSTLFLAFNGFFVFMNKHAQTDTLLVLLIIWFLLSATGGKLAKAISPTFLALAMLTKLTGIFAAAALYCYGVLVSHRSDIAWRRWLLPASKPLVGILLGAAVFLVVYAAHPTAFANTWHTELSTRKSQSCIGFNPFASEGFVDTAKFLAKAMPVTILLGIAGMVGMLRRRSEKHVLPLLWLVFGLAVVAFQNYQPPRFYLPLIPPLSIMAAWLIDERFLSRKGRTTRVFGIAAALLMCLYGPATLYAHFVGHRDTTGPDITLWMNRNLTPDIGVMGISPYGCSANVRYYPQDLYNADTFLSEEEIQRLRIHYILFDDAEWRSYCRKLNSGFESHLKSHHRYVARIGTVEIWRTGLPSDPKSP